MIFTPVFPKVPSVEEILLSLKRKYKKQADFRVSFTDLHLRTKESRMSRHDTPESLERLKYKPRADLPEFLLECPVDWHSDLFGDRNWCLHLNSLRGLDRFYNNFNRTIDVRFLSFPFKIIEDWYDFHFEVGEVKRYNFFMYDDMTCGIRQLRISYIVDKYMAGAVELDDNILYKIAVLLNFHWVNLADAKNFKSTNHTISLLHALMSLAVVIDLEEYLKKEWISMLIKCFEHLVMTQFDNFGIHVENSPEYHFFVLKLFKEIINSGWYNDASEKVLRTLDLASEMCAWMRLPDDRIIPIGDSNARAPVKIRLHSQKKPFKHDEHSLEVLTHPVYSIIKHISSLDEWSFLGVKSGHVNKTHRHKDDLSYLWSESGFDLIVDAGKYAYTKDDFRRYIKSSVAHNTISIYDSNSETKSNVYDFAEDESNPIWTSRSYGGYLELNKVIVNRHNAVNVRRRLFFSPGNWLVVEDEISNSKSGFCSSINFSPDLVWSTETGDFRNSLECRNPVLDIKLNICVASCSKLKILQSSGGETTPELRGFVSRDYKNVEPSPFMNISGSGNIVFAVAFSLGSFLDIEYVNGRLVVTGEDFNGDSIAF